MAADLIDLSPEPQAPQDTIDVLGPSPSVVPADVAAKRAAKFHYGLGPMSPGEDVLRLAAMQGSEPQERYRATLKEELEYQKKRQGLVQSYLKSRPAGAVRQEDIQSILGMAGPEAAAVAAGNPDSYFERKYAQKLLDDNVTQRNTPVQQKATEEAPKEVDRIKAAGEKVISLKENAQKLLEEYEAEYQKMSWGNYAQELAENFVPFKSWWNMQNVLSSAPTSSFLLGNNVKEQADHYYLSDVDTGTANLRKAAEEIKSRNLLDAITYLKFITSYSASDTLLGNILSVADLSIVGELAIAPVIKGSSKAAYTKAVQDVVSANATRDTPKEVLLEAAGDIPAAAQLIAVRKMQDTAEVAGKTDGLQSLQHSAMSVFNPQEMLGGSSAALSREHYQRLEQTLAANAEKLVNATVNDPLNVTRLEPGTLAHRTALDETRKLWNIQYPHLADTVLNVRPIIAHEAPAFNKTQSKAAERYQSLLDAVFNKDPEIGNRYMTYELASKRIQQLAKLVNEEIAEKSRIETKRKSGLRLFDKLPLEDELDKIAEAGIRTRSKAMLAEIDKLVKDLGAISKEEAKLFDGLMKAQANWLKVSKGEPLPRRGAGFEEDLMLPDIPSKKGLGNVDFISIEIGKRDATLFDSEVAAFRAGVEDYGLKDFRVRQQGTGYLIEVQKAIDETSVSVRDALRIDTFGETPKSLANTMLGWFRSKDYIIPDELSNDFKTATYGSSYLQSVAAQVAKDNIGNLSRWDKTSRKRFTEFIEAQRITRNADGEYGRFSTSQAQFEQEWRAKYGSVPDLKESIAYWTYVQLNDIDFTMTNLGMYRDKVRMGLEHHNFRYDAQLAQGSVEPFIEGKIVKELPPRHDKFSAGILVWDRDPSNFRYYSRNFAKQEELDDLVAKGYRIVQLSPMGEEAVRKAPGLEKVFAERFKGPVNFILTKELESAPLPYQQIPYRPGGHHQHMFNFYLRQPKIYSGRGYYGDTTIRGFMAEADAHKFAGRYETGRQLLKQVNAGSATEKELAAFLEKNLPESVAEFKALFDPEKGGVLDIDTKIYVTFRDQTVDKAVKLGVTNMRESPYNLYSGSVNLRNAMERGDDFFTIRETGTTQNPIFNLKRSQLLDALPTMDRSVNSLMRGRYLEDVKHKATERFIAEFGDIIDLPREEMARNPYRVLFGDPDVPWRAGADREMLAAAKNYRRAVMEFLGTKSKFQQDVDFYKQKLADQIFKAAGEKPFTLVEPYLMHRVKGPAQMLKNAMFDLKMSWNPVQLFLQSHTIGHVAAVSGLDNALKAMPASTYMRALSAYSDAPEFIKHYSGLVSKFGWDPKEFAESYEALKRTGFHRVGRETADMDDFLSPPVIKGAWGTFMDAGRSFFKWGEEYARYTAWNAAYIEWRKANPRAALNDDAVKGILARADTLSVNMSSASSASWQKGITGVPTQFWSYQARLWEQFAGGHLTAKERALAMGFYSLWFGVPTAAGIATLGFPAANWIRQKLLDNGIDVDDNIATKIAVDGLGGAAVQFINGGEKLNYSERYGPGNTQFLRDAWGDRSLIETLLGVSYSTLKDAYYATNPVVMAAISTLRGDQENYPLTFKDFENFMSLHSGVNNFRKAYYAASFGEYISKNGMKVDSVDGWAGIVAGMQPQRIADTYHVLANEKERQALMKKEEANYVSFMQAALKALDEDNLELYNTYHRRAKLHLIAGRFREDEKARLFQRVTRGHESLVDRVMRKYAQQSPEKLEYFMKYLKKRGQ